jgi:transglutaminase-like putative cysteine protease
MRALAQICTAFLLAVTFSVTAEPAPAHRSAPTDQGREQRQRLIAGRDGQALLLVDPGRDLGRYLPPRRIWSVLSAPREHEHPRLNALEQARLNARRIWYRSRLDGSQKLDALVRLANKRFPKAQSETAYAARKLTYEQFNQGEVQRTGQVRLSRYASKRLGSCREWSFLLSTLLNEVGVRARVVYGKAYDHEGQLVDGHAWVEARIGFRRRVFDPLSGGELKSWRSVRTTEQRSDGLSRIAQGVEGSDGLLLLPDPSSDQPF